MYNYLFKMQEKTNLNLIKMQFKLAFMLNQGS